jgi:hypothetical protein
VSRIGNMLVGVLFCLSFSSQVLAQDRSEVAPWVFEIKGGQFKPDLDLYEEFYGSDKTNYFAAAFAYRSSDWYEFGGELGYMHDSGVGLFESSQTLGGSVKYKLLPASLYASVFGRFSPDQWVVPYAGVGLTMAWYKQDIASQSNRSGRSDLGYNAKAGLQLLVNGMDRGTAQRAARGGLINTYLFIESQYFSTKVDGHDLGGITYLLGLRLEFDFSH